MLTVRGFRRMVRRGVWLSAMLVVAGGVWAQSPEAPAPAGGAASAPAAAAPAAMSMEELSKQVSNPLSRIWSLAFQNDYDAVTSDLLQTDLGHINVSTFQPVLPMPVGQYTFFARPVIPLVTRPRLNNGLPLELDGHTAGLGDGGGCG